jgi:hypothetical protein
MHRPDGTTSDWAAGLPGGEALREASLAARGASVWLLTGEAAEHPRWLRVRRATAPGTVESRPDAEMIARPSGGDGSIAGVAPDDSIIAISVVRDWTARGAKVALVRTDGREAATIHDGRFAGFVPADLFPMP